MTLEGLLSNAHAFAKKTVEVIADLSTSVEVWYQLRGLRSLVRSGIPAVSLAVVPIYAMAGCGEEETPCDTAADCSEGRYCGPEGVCVGEVYEGGDSGGGSPLVGKTLTALFDCDNFIVFQEDCKAIIYGLERRSDDQSLFELGFCDYSGLNILNCNISYFQDATFYPEWDNLRGLNECQKDVFQRLDSYLAFSQRTLENYEDPNHPDYHQLHQVIIWTSIDRQFDSKDDCKDLRHEIEGQLGYERGACSEYVPVDQPE